MNEQADLGQISHRARQGRIRGGWRSEHGPDLATAGAAGDRRQLGILRRAAGNPFWSVIKRWRTSCGEESWVALVVPSPYFGERRTLTSFGSHPSATTRTPISRPVTTPARRLPSVTGSASQSSSDISRAAGMGPVRPVHCSTSRGRIAGGATSVLPRRQVGGELGLSFRDIEAGLAKELDHMIAEDSLTSLTGEDISSRCVNAPISMSASVSRSMFLASNPAICARSKARTNARRGGVVGLAVDFDQLRVVG